MKRGVRQGQNNRWKQKNISVGMVKDGKKEKLHPKIGALEEFTHYLG